MKKTLSRIAILLSFLALGFTFSPSQPTYAACSGQGGGDILGIPHWYKYLEDDVPTSLVTGKCVAKFTDFKDIVLIVFAIIEIGIRIATYMGIIFFIYGAIQLTVSQGSPENVNKARQTIINALVGVAIALLATAIVNFIGLKLG